MILRPEQAADIAAIRAITQAAFATAPYSDGSEGQIIDQLRADDDLAMSLVADQDGAVVGQVTLTAVSIGDSKSGWFGIGPIAVAPEKMGQGIGSALMKAAIDHLNTIGAAGVVLVGDPAYYARFGFVADGSVTYGGLPSEIVQHLVLNGPLQTGAITYPPALHGS